MLFIEMVYLAMPSRDVSNMPVHKNVIFSAATGPEISISSSGFSNIDVNVYEGQVKHTQLSHGARYFCVLGYLVFS